MDIHMRNSLAVLACMIGLALAGCTTTADGTRVPDAGRIARDAAAARAAYCALPEATRAAIRAKATDGLTLIVC